MFAYAGALLIEGVLVLLTVVVPDSSGTVGTPIPISHVRRGPVSTLLEGSPAPTGLQVASDWFVFFLDVIVTALPLCLLMLIVRVGAANILLAAAAGLLCASGLAWVMNGLGLPWVGFPIPVGRTPSGEVWYLGLWLDILLLAGAIAIVLSRLPDTE